MNARNILFPSLLGKLQNMFTMRLHPPCTILKRLITTENSPKFSQTQSSSSSTSDDYGSFFGFKHVENGHREQLGL